MKITNLSYLLGAYLLLSSCHKDIPHNQIIEEPPINRPLLVKKVSFTQERVVDSHYMALLFQYDSRGRVVSRRSLDPVDGKTLYIDSIGYAGAISCFIRASAQILVMRYMNSCLDLAIPCQ